MTNERTPLLWNYANSSSNATAIGKSKEAESNDLHAQFCMLVGVPSTSADTPKGERVKPPPPKSLYGRALRQLSAQRFTYYATASLSNTLLLTQVVLGAALTGLGASESSHILITVFGALNTIIAGVVAYLKSRGQPMRARMYRDDLERVVDEIENSEIMWLGISRGVHGYDEIDTDEHRVTVRSEVARLTRLFDRAVRNNSLNNPDMYMAGAGFDGSNTTLKSRSQPAPVPIPIAAGPAPVVAAPVVDTPSVPPAVGALPVATAPVPDPDESPASAPPKRKKEEVKKEEAKKQENKDENASKEEPVVEENNSTSGKEKEKENEKEKEKEKAEGEETKKDTESSATPASGADASSSKDAPAPAPTRPAPAFDPDASPATSPDVPTKKKENTK